MSDQTRDSRGRVLTFMASLSWAAGQSRAAEGYILELLAWCTFAIRDEQSPKVPL